MSADPAAGTDHRPDRAALLAAALPAQTAQVVDASGLLCPLPIVHLGKALRTAAPGDVIHVIATDEGFFPDLERWIRVRRASIAALRETPGERFEAWVRSDA